MAHDFPNLPVRVLPSSSIKRLGHLSSSDIRTRFRRDGALLFRGFSPSIEEFKAFTAQFCQYFIAYPGSKRGRVNDETNIQTVDMDKAGIPFHSELSYSPVRPDLAWFFCVVPPRRGSATILCDGIALAEALPSNMREWLEKRKLRFKAELGRRTWQRLFGCVTIPQVKEMIRQRSYANVIVAGDKVHIDHLTAPLAPTKYDTRVAFCNNLILHRGKASAVPFADGSILCDELYEQLVRVSERLTIEIAWKAGDLLMVDNTRMMHGRRPVLDDDRLIWTRFGS